MTMPPQLVHPWTFLSNHAHVLICLSQDSETRLRDVADRVGITERAVQRIVADLHEAGYITIHKEGRRNSYRVQRRKTLRHPIERKVTLGELIDLVPDAKEARPPKSRS